MVINVKTQTGEYPIFLERGALKRVGEIVKGHSRVLVVTDSGVPDEYSASVSAQLGNAQIYKFPMGEQSKCFDTYLAIMRVLCENGFTRSDALVAVGGGVVGDLTGFVAATFLRGIAFYNIPTTLLSQVDSSIGGKVAVDFDGYKNNVGAFYPPKAVVIDPDTLRTLPERQLANGLAEAIKMSLTGDSELFALFENADIKESIDLIIEKSLRYKKYVVENDEKENGLRRVLNFGHTVGHAIESKGDFNSLYHGECVALGMLPMCDEKVRNRLVAVLKKVGLPYEIPYSLQELQEAMHHDKKMSGDSITVVRVEKVGEAVMPEMPFNEFVNSLS